GEGGGLGGHAGRRARRAQLAPLFLSNTLRSIGALTPADPAAARRMCLQLADFLRETLALGAQARIPLSSELALARRFLAIEQVRFGDRLQVDVGASPDAEACEVPPLLLQPLVENAVTHGVARAIAAGTAAGRAGAHRRGAVRAGHPRGPGDGPRFAQRPRAAAE